jgi:hypothetical protein
MVVKRSYKEFSGDDYQIVPPIIIPFENSTFRTADDEVIALIDAKIEKRRREGKEQIVIKIKDERLVAALSDPKRDVQPVVSEKIKHNTSVEEALIS